MAILRCQTALVITLKSTVPLYWSLSLSPFLLLFRRICFPFLWIIFCCCCQAACHGQCATLRFCFTHPSLIFSEILPVFRPFLRWTQTAGLVVHAGLLPTPPPPGSAHSEAGPWLPLPTSSRATSTCPVTK